MTDYRNFADSIFSREIWDHEGRIWIIIALSILALLSVIFLFARSYRNESLMFAALSGVVIMATAVICVGLFGSIAVSEFNSIVAQKNVAMKYDESKLQHYTYDAKERILKATYDDRKTSIHEEVTFTFEPDGTQPFLEKGTNTDENFSNIEQALSTAG